MAEYQWNLRDIEELGHRSKIAPNIYSRDRFIDVHIEMLRRLCIHSLARTYSLSYIENLSTFFITQIIWAEQQEETFFEAELSRFKLSKQIPLLQSMISLNRRRN